MLPAGSSDDVSMSAAGQAAAEASATTARRDASLEKLAKGPVEINGQTISQKDGYKAVSDASWDRFNGAFKNLPEGARQGIQEQFNVVASDWSKQPGNLERFQRASPEMQQEYKWQWQAQAASQYGSSAGAQGSAADLVNLADGGRQYVTARAGYLLAGGTPGQ
ncbi:MAG: hypothetical protein U0931_13510 [Vulcanimicrobiota bacterium]